MTPFQEIKEKANNLRKAKDYENALPLYKDLWDNYKDDCGKWEGWGYAQCLNKLKNFDDSMNICRKTYKIDQTFNLNNNLYAWNIYHTEIAKNQVQNESVFFKAAKGIILLSEEDEYSPYVITIFKVIDYLNEQNRVNYNEVITWIEYLKPELLDETPFSFQDKDGKTREIASKKEQYYSNRSKAFFELGQFENCIIICEEALNTLTKFHYSNDIWFKRSIALSNAQLGSNDLAITQLVEILKQKNEWFIQKEIAEIYLKNNKLKDAEKYAIDAALNYGDNDKKMNLYLLLNDILQRQGKNNEARNHILFIAKIRIDKKWKIDTDLKQKIDFYNIDLNDLPNFNSIKRDLIKTWEDLKFGDKQYNGIIKKMLPNNKSGFIELENSRLSYYFDVRDFKGQKNLVKEGTKVRFYLEDSFNKKRNEKSKKAVMIKSIR
jgi:tetratricopeptide (TPR) repeat protein